MWVIDCGHINFFSGTPFLICVGHESKIVENFILDLSNKIKILFNFGDEIYISFDTSNTQAGGPKSLNNYLPLIWPCKS